MSSSIHIVKSARKIVFLLMALWCFTFNSDAHQAPYAIVRLDIKSNGINAELELPLDELELAFGNDVTRNTETLEQRLGPSLRDYIKSHFHALTGDGIPWSIEVTDIVVAAAKQTARGAFQEIKVQVWMTPPPERSSRNFVLNYDVIMHEVVNHYAVVTIRTDWESGIDANNPLEVGVIQRDAYNKIPPFMINRESTSWDGFKNMFALGMRHISEGTDHLLFLLALLLSAPLIVKAEKWVDVGDTRYSLRRVIYVVTAFTIGHSLTLVIGSLEWIRLPSQPIEIAIALSILVSAFHAIRPVFPGREPLVAMLFGLIHGLAFADTLAGLDLNAGQMALSILGFNLGIELMQLFIIMLIMPWLLLLTRTSLYKLTKISGATVAMIAAIGWVIERVTQKGNFITGFIGELEIYAYWIIVVLAFFAIVTYAIEQATSNQKQTR